MHKNGKFNAKNIKWIIINNTCNLHYKMIEDKLQEK